MTLLLKLDMVKMSQQIHRQTQRQTHRYYENVAFGLDLNPGQEALFRSSMQHSIEAIMSTLFVIEFH